MNKAFVCDESIMSTALLPVIQTELNRFGLASIFIFGVIGNCWILILFSQHRQKSCSMYLFWASMINNLCIMMKFSISMRSTQSLDLIIR